MPLIDLRAQAKRRSTSQLLKHMQSFSLDIRGSAGVWFFSPAGGRFHEKYAQDFTMEEILEKAAGLARYGLRAVEGHYPNEVNDETIPLFQNLQRETGIRLVTVVPNLFYERQFEFGALSSPIPKVRRAAIRRVKETLQLNNELDTDFAIVWPGIDGYENNFGINFYAARDRFASGLAEAMNEVPGVRIALEPKPYEPRGRILYGTTPEAILCCEKVEGMLRNEKNLNILKRGHALMAMNPEVGHMLMAFEDAAYSFSLAMEYGRLAHTHWNSQPLGNYDQDLNLGVVSPEQAEAAMYALKMCGYSGYFGVDIWPGRMPVEQALINNMDMLKAINDRIDRLDHEKILACTEKPDQNRGVLEALLIRARYGDGKLSRTPQVVL